MADIFHKIILTGRPASGKSEIIDYIKRTPPVDRHERFHLGNIIEIDDFPMLWTWFEEDKILTDILKKPRMHTTDDGDFIHQYQWNLLIERINLEYKKKIRDYRDLHSDHTILIEFSRGTEHGGYKEAFGHLSDDILKKSALVYVNVSYEESLRKNRKRFKPDMPDSILHHGLPDHKLEKLYKEVDWEEVSKGSDTHLTINGIKIPYVVFENVPSKTDDIELLGPALDDVFQRLWQLYKQK